MFRCSVSGTHLVRTAGRHRNIRCSGYLGQVHAVLETGGRASNRHNAASRSLSVNVVRLSVGGSLCGRSAMVRVLREITDGSLYHKDGTIFFSMKVALTYD